MEINWSLIDAVLVIALAIVLGWAALKLVARVLIAAAFVAIILVVFFGVHLSDFGIRLG
ncbi:MAG: hypothetical protein KJZ75_08060 [Hyphomonadaceae bacterium]|nr:hypothetical protein [Hyphomonadaceae bacterium]GIK48395.1 MAG: hypothetical protein BroJett013_10920 [Alphaproteobacteria bacterium]